LLVTGRGSAEVLQKQCCGSRIFYPGSEFFHPGSRVAKIPDPEPYPKCKYQGSLETIVGVKNTYVL
jgi:hypothetical protein